MVRVLAILILLVVGLGGLAVASIGLVFKLVGALFWIVLALVAYLVWSRSRSAS